MKPLIALVGRPNVGKSTLFNRLIGKRLAVISDVAGTTRDRIYQNIEMDDIEVTLVDTGGLSYGKKESLEAEIQTQAHLAIEKADIIYFVVDASHQLTVDDFAAADILRKTKKPVLFIANKYDGKEAIDRLMELYEIGFGEPLAISAIHNRGIDELVQRTTKLLKKLPKEKRKKVKEDKNSVHISFLGKPNVGKSSLVNALLGEDRVIVSDIPGTTRDSTNTHIEFEDKKYTLIDTAGLRKRGKIERGIEKFSSLRCFQALDQSDVALLILDFDERISKQDMHIAGYILEAKKGVIIVVNKIDLTEEEKDRDKFLRLVQRKFSFLPWAPLVFVSALKKKNITKIYELAEQIVEERKKRIPTGELNNFIKKITFKHVPSGTKRIKPKIFYVTQTGINPPEFVFFVNQANAIHFSYRRYLENELRKEYGFGGTALKLEFRSRSERA
ncbi:ribosome biogenesis GTPase Der [Patescibacteria group bacterium]